MSLSSDPIVQLREAIALAQSGQREAARSLLLELTAAHPNLELAWMWLASVTDEPNERVAILRRVLELNPANDKARAALSRLVADNPEPEIESAPPAAPEPPVESPVAPIPSPPNRSGIETALTIVAIVIAVIVIVLIGLNVLGGRLFAQPTATLTLAPTFTPTFTPAISLTPSITPGGPTFTPFIQDTLPPTWTPAPTDTPPPTFTPLPTDTELPSATATPTTAIPTLGSSATPTLTPTLAPLATIAQSTGSAPPIISTSAPVPATAVPTSSQTL